MSAEAPPLAIALSDELANATLGSRGTAAYRILTRVTQR